MSYRKGYLYEWKLTHELAKKGFMVVRTPRSGRIGLPSPDIIALKNGKIFVIEAKAREEAFKIEAEQLNELKQWQDNGATAFIAWKISREGWKFLKLDDVIKNNGNIGKKFAMEKSFGIEFFDDI
ncbi:MAG TPA: hypothetical protein VJB11_01825 [archaeon]|nr:hypothetical protein [archaeon]